MRASTVTKRESLGRYQVIQKLAEGGMADVLIARTRGIEGFERHVVIKRIRAAQARDERYVAMFLDEARLAASLHHHNIVQVNDIGEEAGEYFFAMEYVHGEDVRKLLTAVARKKTTIPLEHVITIATATAAGLHHAHEQRKPDRTPLDIVHCDVSPANILIGYDGGVKVVDFGIAKAAYHHETTGTGMLKGKAAYMSPEQCNSEPIDRRSDVFSLGIVLYELLTTTPLFQYDNDFLSMSAIVNGTIVPPSQRCPGLAPELEAITLKALANRREDRYATADEMRLALEQYANTAGLRTSTTALADYMKSQFGSRPEPWLARDEDDDPEISLFSTGQIPVVINPIITEAMPVIAATPVSPARSPRRWKRWAAAAAVVVGGLSLALVQPWRGAVGERRAEAAPIVAPAPAAVAPAPPPAPEPKPAPIADPEPVIEAAPVPVAPPKHHHHSTKPNPATPAKHWDPHALFPE